MGSFAVSIAVCVGDSHYRPLYACCLAVGVGRTLAMWEALVELEETCLFLGAMLSRESVPGAWEVN